MDGSEVGVREGGQRGNDALEDTASSAPSAETGKTVADAPQCEAVLVTQLLELGKDAVRDARDRCPHLAGQYKSKRQQAECDEPLA